VEADTWQHEVGGGPGPTGRWWAAGNGTTATHASAMSALKKGEDDRWGPGNSAGWRRFKFVSNFQFKRIQTSSNHFKFDQPKRDLPELEKFEIKYGCEGFEEGNNVIHRNFLRFEMDYELKKW
jgi:hypothetical protein